jgi:hypothetical protein
MDLLKNLDNMITAKLILTGKETYDAEYSTVSKYDAIEAMIEFAKLHVKAALIEASEYAEMIADKEQDFRLQNCNCTDYIIDKNSILNAYPLENIK